MAAALTPSDPGIEPRLRLRMTSKLVATNRLDGAWWPHSRVVSDEVPGLVRAIASRLGRIRVVFLHSADWDELALTWALPGIRAPLISWSATSDHRHVAGLVRDDGRRIELMLIPVEASEADAQRMIETASAMDNTLSPSQTLDLVRARPRP